MRTCFSVLFPGLQRNPSRHRRGAAVIPAVIADSRTFWLAIIEGVPSVRVTTADELVVALRRSYATPGPTFIEAVLPKGLG